MLTKTTFAAAAIALFGIVGHNTTDTDTNPSDYDIPEDFANHYLAHADTCDNMTWQLLAAIGKVETDHGRSPLPGVHSGTNSAGAAGPTQFLPWVFQAMRDLHPDIGDNQYDGNTAVHATAHYLCDEGVATGDIRDAIYAYNHANWYVREVQDQADAYSE